VPQSQAVDFARELGVVEAFLHQAGFRLAVIGGVALTAYGHPRMTLDLDVVTEAAAQDALIGFMESQGFETLHRSSGYSNHRHSDRSRGRVDFMYVQGTTAHKLFAFAKELPGPGGRPILVPIPEHLIAMKVQAMKDAPERTWQDLVDIAYLFRLDGVNRDEVRQYFERAGLVEKWNELTQVR
jgi:Nucleotidyl transferase AbiEii toxin, Type IV TA system